MKEKKRLNVMIDKEHYEWLKDNGFMISRFINKLLKERIEKEKEK